MKGQHMQNRKKGKKALNGDDHSHMALKGIRKMLYYKDLVPGQKVSIRDIAEKLDMSMTPIIQALKFMEFQGLTRHEPNRGYFMTPLSVTELEEIYELREVIEPSLVPFAMQNLNSKNKKQLKAAFEDHLSAQREIFLQERYFKNSEFHLALASMSNKPTQIRFLRNMFDLLLLKYGGNSESIETMKLVDVEHQKIYESVISSDVQESINILTNHIKNVKKQVLDRFRRVLDRKDLPEI
jgi:DNA-binding GntR family transcriptional regulator